VTGKQVITIDREQVITIDREPGDVTIDRETGDNHGQGNR
jgi:hypothetical protein